MNEEEHKATFCCCCVQAVLMRFVDQNALSLRAPFFVIFLRASGNDRPMVIADGDGRTPRRSAQHL